MGLVPLFEHTVHGLLLWPDQPRQMEIDLDSPAALGPVVLQAVVGREGEATGRSSTTGWLWPTPLVLAVLVLATAGAVLVWRRQRGR